MEIVSYFTRGGRAAEKVWWSGKWWRRYPDSPASGNRYFRRTARKGTTGPLLHFWLHQEVWAALRGPIPDGQVVHHKDENIANNVIGNLDLCTPREHGLIHRENMEKAGLAARAWHSSPEGIAWHKAHGKRVFGNRKPSAFRCERCGKAYRSTNAGRNRFCGLNCRVAARRDSGVDDVARRCVQCGVEFTVNRYAKKEHCSLSCASIGRQARRKAARLAGSVQPRD